MEKVLLVDGMGCLYNEDFVINTKLLEILQLFDIQKILVVNGFREKARKLLEEKKFLFFSLEEEGIKKTNPDYFERLLSIYQLTPEQVLYFDHDETNVETSTKSWHSFTSLYN